MTVTLTPRKNAASGGGERKCEITCDLAFSSNYATGGDTVNICAVPDIKVSKNRVLDQFWINNSNGYSMSYMKGTDLTNGKIKINTAVNTELGAGAYPAQITGDTNLWCVIVFQKL